MSCRWYFRYCSMLHLKFLWKLLKILHIHITATEISCFVSIHEWQWFTVHCTRVWATIWVPFWYGLAVILHLFVENRISIMAIKSLTHVELLLIILLSFKCNSTFAISRKHTQVAIYLVFFFILVCWYLKTFYMVKANEKFHSCEYRSDRPWVLWIKIVSSGSICKLNLSVRIG